MHEHYLRELSGLETYYCEHGFFLYMLSKEASSLDVAGFYVKPEFRNGLFAKHIFKEIINLAKEFGCKRVTGSVVTNFNDPETAMYNMLRMKFKFLKIENEIIYFYLDI